MAIRKTGELANSVMRANGIYSEDGSVMLMANDGSRYAHRKELMDKWNGVEAKKVVVKKPKVQAAPIAKPEARGTRKATPKKSKAKKWFGRK